MDESSQDVLLRCCAEVSVHLAARISKIVAERDSCNDSGEDIFPVLPHEQICMNMRRLVRSLEQHDAGLKCRFSE